MVARYQTQTTAQLKGQFPGSAIWSAHLYKDNDVQVDDGSWGARVSGGNFRPDEAALIAQYKVYFGCGGDEQCSDIRCRFCWDEEDTLDSSLLECSRHVRVAQVVSCGQGRLKGGDVKAATRPGPPDDWALGQGQGDDVEIFNNHRRRATMDRHQQTKSPSARSSTSSSVTKETRTP
ncbi:unnamed protein product [Ectocarpus sp. CCAP 1310/34]|nr:unnamed protein product [Ectocarpus sp. CCAP 1310/34]